MIQLKKRLPFEQVDKSDISIVNSYIEEKIALHSLGGDQAAVIAARCTGFKHSPGLQPQRIPEIILIEAGIAHPEFNILYPWYTIKGFGHSRVFIVLRGNNRIITR